MALPKISLAKFQLNCKRLAVSFLSDSLYLRVSNFCQNILGISIFFNLVISGSLFFGEAT